MTSVQTPNAFPRTHSAMSSESKKGHKSRSSSGSHKMDLTESPKDKLRITGKADPSMAMYEAQPAAIALEQPTIGDLRRATFTGRDGQPIVEPDSSNPTRYRWERPLDTIKSFEEDINRTYREKHVSNAPTRPQSRGDMYGRAANRRSSYFSYNAPQSPGPNNAYASGGGGGGGYYGSGYDNGGSNGYYQHSNSYQGNSGYGNNGQYQNGEDYQAAQAEYGQGQYLQPKRGGQPRFTRGSTEPNLSSNGAVQGYHNYHQSRETVSTAPSPDTDPHTYSTNPSSQNSSMDQFAPFTTPKLSMGAPTQQAPRVPPKGNVPIQGGSDYYHDEEQSKKRGSWFKRRFSKG